MIGLQDSNSIQNARLPILVMNRFGSMVALLVKASISARRQTVNGNSMLEKECSLNAAERDWTTFSKQVKQVKQAESMSDSVDKVTSTNLAG